MSVPTLTQTLAPGSLSSFVKEGSPTAQAVIKSPTGETTEVKKFISSHVWRPEGQRQGLEESVSGEDSRPGLQAFSPCPHMEKGRE